MCVEGGGGGGIVDNIPSREVQKIILKGSNVKVQGIS